MAEALTATAIQKHLPIQDIRDGVVVLKSGALRAVLMASSMNFALKSIQEQDAVTFQYQGFLNSLDFPVQIMVASRKFDISDYLRILEEKERGQENELLKIQTAEYIDFVKGLTEVANIMTESFYLVIPFSPSPIKKLGLLDKFGLKKKSAPAQDESFEQLKSQLWQRVEFVISGLSGAGIKAVPLNTEELIELFYKLYNPSAREAPELEKAKELRIQ